MRLKKITCPACGGDLNMDIKDRKYIFCPYCGSQIAVDNGEKNIYP